MCSAILVTIHIYHFSSSECYDGSVRLIGGENGAEGIVELCRNFRWGGTVCDMGWDDRDAVVACRNAGFFGGTLLFTTIHYLGCTYVSIMHSSAQN